MPPRSPVPIGQRFGRLVVVGAAPPASYGASRWLCRCDCGKEIPIVTYSLKSGNTLSCGCLSAELGSARRRARTSDLTGLTFGRLRVVGPVQYTGQRSAAMWPTVCSCGTPRLVSASSLLGGETKSCGCLNLDLIHSRVGPQSSRWNGGRYVGTGGYIMVNVGPARRERREHRVIMERIMGRPLLRSESVHHRNGDRSDNRPENLELWSHSQPKGQRIADKVKWARELLLLYEPDVLSDQTPVDLPESELPRSP